MAGNSGTQQDIPGTNSMHASCITRHQKVGATTGRATHCLPHRERTDAHQPWGRRWGTRRPHRMPQGHPGCSAGRTWLQGSRCRCPQGCSAQGERRPVSGQPLAGRRAGRQAGRQAGWAPLLPTQTHSPLLALSGALARSVSAGGAGNAHGAACTRGCTDTDMRRWRWRSSGTRI